LPDAVSALHLAVWGAATFSRVLPDFQSAKVRKVSSKADPLSTACPYPVPKDNQ